MIIRMLRINKYDRLARTLRQHRFALRPVPATDSLVEPGWRLMFHPRPIEAGEGPPATRHGWRQAGSDPLRGGTGCHGLSGDRSGSRIQGQRGDPRRVCPLRPGWQGRLALPS